MTAPHEVFKHLKITSPKRNKKAQTGWEGFFPYYAGYPETFAKDILASADLSGDAVILDPWNGSGTTTYSAATLGLASRGMDLNPAMIVIARARLLPPSEADSLEPIAKEVARIAKRARSRGCESEPLRAWFTDETATSIRAIESSIRRHLLGGLTLTPEGPNLDKLSGLAATFYVALFTVCRGLASPFQASNPTWLRVPKSDETRVKLSLERMTGRLTETISSMSAALAQRAQLSLNEYGPSEIRLADTATTTINPSSVDLVLTSPPYCTRIDYTAATRVELAILAPLLRGTTEEISRRMIGSTRVPIHARDVSERWGARCASFLDALRCHPSKASNGYYYKTHLDYFDKMDRSIEKIASALKPGGRAILVVQDSNYKELHNDLPSFIADIGEAHGLLLGRREEFHLSRSMSGINPHTRLYKRTPGAVEAVLCFQKVDGVERDNRDKAG